MILNILIALVILAALYLFISIAFPKQLFFVVIRIGRRLAGLRLRSVEVDGSSWNFLEGGPASGEVLLLLHGFGGDKDNWTLYAKYFTRRFRVIIPDLPGFGDSERDSEADYTIAAQTERLREFILTLGLDRSHIAGNSMGGYLALKFALKFPEKVLTLGLLNSAGVIGTNRSELELAAERGESLLTVNTMEEFRNLIALITQRWVPVPGFVRRVLCTEAVRHHNFLEQIFWALTDEIRSQPLNDQLQRVATPTLIIWGRQDRVIDVSCAEVLGAAIPTNRCVVLENTGHIPMIERPARTAASHLEFIDAYRAV